MGCGGWACAFPSRAVALDSEFITHHFPACAASLSFARKPIVSFDIKTLRRQLSAACSWRFSYSLPHEPGCAR